MTVHIENEYGEAFSFDWEALIKRVVEAALDLEECPYEADVSVLLTGDDEIREMNADYRGIDRSTDVLSFPMLDFPAPADFSGVEVDPDAFDPESGELLLGDIVISTDHVKAQAALYGHSEERELGFLVAHSMLHLMGYDHPEGGLPEDGPVLMEIKQEKILESLDLRRE